MGKYNSLKVLKKTKARTQHICHNCGKEKQRGVTYYREHIEDRFLHSLYAKKYCASCFEEHSEDIAKWKRIDMSA